MKGCAIVLTICVRVSSEEELAIVKGGHVLLAHWPRVMLIRCEGVSRNVLVLWNRFSAA